MSNSSATWRIVLFRAFVLVAFAVLAGRLWRLQILHSGSYQLQADANRFRLVPVDAPRGVIYDRYGRLLARNIPSYTISIIPSALPKAKEAREAVLSRLSQLLDIPVSSKTASLGSSGTVQGIEEILEQNTISPYLPVAIKKNVDKQVAFLIEEENLYLPGVIVEIAPRREYPTGSLTSHIVGYVGYIPAEKVQDYLDQTEEGYTINDQVGLMGVEAAYEKEMHGRKGQKHIEVDAYGREVNVLAIDPPQPGYSLLLTLDLDLQHVAENALREGMQRVGSTAGVVIAMNPQTGEILAMVSLPSYDNNLFAKGITAQDYEQLQSDPERPLVNHAISGQYPPGSTFKIIPAAAGLEEGVIDYRTKITCAGKLLLPNKYFPDDPTKAQEFKCWNPWGHGALNVIDALAYSCDIYFYQVGGGFENFTGLGIERLGEYARAFGLGEPTGIALPGEAAGLVPDDRWKRVNYGEPWVTGDTYNAVIGQGYVLVTPLQLLNATAAIANGGILYRPQVVYRVIDHEGHVIRDYTPEVIRRLPVSAQNLEIVREGMRAAVTRGTAHRVNLAEIPVAGKTGTAEYPGPRDAEGNLPTHAWFTAFAPYDDPEIALVVFVSGGHEGAKVAVPIAAQILRAYYGLSLLPSEELVAPPPGD
ncbi:MAG: penicillin-binding protein 2 [Chloroflexi bacterium]|nr:penicillin-binding protein 2 [Chloroflexota bacterium]